MAALGKSAAHVSGTLRFAAPSTFAQLYVAPILPKFMERYPDITLDLRLSDVQFDPIEGSHDLALRNSPLLDSSLKGRKLADGTRILCASPTYLGIHGAPETPSDLASHKLIAFRNLRPRGLKNTQGHAAEFDSGAAHSQLIVDDGLSQKRSTLAWAGISLNALWSVHEEIGSGQLIRVLPEYEGSGGNVLWLIFPKSNVLLPKARVFMDLLIAEIGKTPPWEQ